MHKIALEQKDLYQRWTASNIMGVEDPNLERCNDGSMLPNPKDLRKVLAHSFWTQLSQKSAERNNIIFLRGTASQPIGG